MRADSRENRARLLAAAETVFAGRGLDCSLEHVAKAAGVGIGTLYRHFPSRLHLVGALRAWYLELLDEVIVAGRTIPSGWDRLVHYIDGGLVIMLAHPLMYAVGDWMRRADPTLAADQRWDEEILETVRLAHEEGALRPDATATDLALLPHMLSALGSLPEPIRSLAVARQRTILLDGMRRGAPNATELPDLAITPEQLASVTGLSRETAP